MKTALDYANESIQWYIENSARNPANMERYGLTMELPGWEKNLRKEKLEIYLMTILERMPYDLPEKK